MEYTGEVLVRYWRNTGEILARYWRILARYWRDTGDIVYQRMSSKKHEDPYDLSPDERAGADGALCMYVCMCVCMYVRTYIHTYIHTYINKVHIYIACFVSLLFILRSGFRGKHLPNTTCLTHGFFKSGE